MKPKLLFCLSSGYSLSLWKNKGMISREIGIIDKLSRDFDLTLFSYGRGNNEEIIAAKYDLEIDIYAINCESRWQIPMSIYHAIKIGLTRKFHIVRSNQFSGSWVCFVVSLLNDCFYTIRSGYNYYTHVVSKSNNRFYKVFYKLFEHLNLRRANLVICTAEEQMIYYRNKYPSVKLLKLHNHVDLDIFKPLTPSEKIEYEFIIVSKFTHQKNLINTIDFLKKFKKPTLIIGKGLDSELSNTLLRVIKDNSHWLTHKLTVPNQELPSYFRKSSFFVNFSLYEGNPKAVIEAYCSGALLLLSDIEAHRELKHIFKDRAILLNLELISSNHTLQYEYFLKHFKDADLDDLNVDSFDSEKAYQLEIFNYNF